MLNAGPSVFVNALTIKSGGSQTILTGLLSKLQSANAGRYVVLVHHRASYARFETERVKIFDLPKWCSKTLCLPFTNHFALPRLVERHGCELVFTLTDVPMPTSRRQIFLFDWAYALYPESPAWKRMGWKGRAFRRLKTRIFRHYVPYVDTFIAQTDAIGDRLMRLFGARRVEIVPNVVSFDRSSRGARSFALKPRWNLVYPTRYYPHKNIEILIPLAREIRRRGVDIGFVTTLAPTEHASVRAFLEQIRQEGLEDIVVNVGPLSHDDVAALYEQGDGLFMPTLLESFGLPFVEAMHHRKPVFTSDFDFTRAVCGEAAYYFDPLNPAQILDRIEEARRDSAQRELRVQKGVERLRDFAAGADTFTSYLDICARGASSSEGPAA